MKCVGCLVLLSLAGSLGWIITSHRTKHKKELCSTRSIEAKAVCGAVHGEDILKATVQLPVATWSYKTDPRQARHIGPMAQDFSKTYRPVFSTSFSLNERRIDLIDYCGILLVAVQQLAHQYVALEGRLDHLEQRAVLSRWPVWFSHRLKRVTRRKNL
jgi:hypothetical protein